MSDSSTPPTTAAHFLRWLPILAFSAVIAHHFWFVNSHAPNIPYQDDVLDLLHFVSLVESTAGADSQFQEWFRQYVDHRTIASRLQVYGAYLVQGEVNFHSLSLLTNLALPLILLLFYLRVREEEERWILLLASALLLLHLRFFSLIVWSQAAFAYYYVFFYAFACLFALHKVTPAKFALAAVLCTLSSFTYAAGQIVWALGFASLVHQWFVTGRRPFLYPATWMFIAIAMLMVWRIGFVSQFSEVSAELVLPLFPDWLIDPPLSQALVRYAAWFLVILGCAFTGSSTLVAGTAGFVMLAFLSFATIKFYRDEDIRLELCGWFVVGSAAAVSIGRAMWQAPDYILDTRYSLFSVLLMCILVLVAQVRFAFFRRAVTAYIVVLFAGIYWLWTYHHFEIPLQNRLEERYADFNKGHYLVFGYPLGKTNAIVLDAVSAGIYNPPCRPFPDCERSEEGFAPKHGNRSANETP